MKFLVVRKVGLPLLGIYVGLALSSGAHLAYAAELSEPLETSVETLSIEHTQETRPIDHTQETRPVDHTQGTLVAGRVLRGAARGAALGAVGGAIAGDAGRGAAIGAAVGGVSNIIF